MSFSFVSGRFIPDQLSSQDSLQYDPSNSSHLLYMDRRNNRIERYDNLGILRQITSADGRTLNFSYSDLQNTKGITATLPTKLTDNFGRTVIFGYTLNSAGNYRITSITANGDIRSRIRLQYDGNDNLAAIIWPDGRSTRMLYEAGGDTSLLTGLIDESNTRISTYTYHPGGTAATTSQAGGVNRYSLTYQRLPVTSVVDVFSPAADVVYRTLTRDDPQSISVSYPNGSTTSVATVQVGGVNHLVSQLQPAGAGCAASTMSQSFDAHGNTASRIDFNGHRACYAYDMGRNLELVRVEGLPPNQACSTVLNQNSSLPGVARKASQRWHPDWRMPSSLARPGRITTFVYNGQPDPLRANAIAKCAPDDAMLPTGKPIVVLCRQIEQATTDETGTLGFSATGLDNPPPRIQSWTYNRAGQILAHDGPRSDIQDVTRFRYYSDTTGDHTTGDLQSRIDAVGRVTQYIAFDKAGRILKVLDPNGTLTSDSYDLRGRRTSTTVGQETTSFAYDATGQLKQVSSADGSVLSYQYDAARRHTGTIDGVGNRVVYTLDATGNQVREQYIDASGMVRREINRSFDQLGRVQLISGRP